MTNRTPESWVQKSHRVSGIKENPFLAFNYQSLGKLEYRLFEEWEEMKKDLDNPENILRFDMHAYLSRLWVLDGYEFLRHISRLDKRAEVDEAHELFRKVRIPLVKFEAPDARNGISYPTYFGEAYLALGQNTKDVGWAVAPDIFIPRDQLAEALYSLY